MNLLIDIGNSRIKAATGIPGKRNIRLITIISYCQAEFENKFISVFKQLKYQTLEKTGISTSINTDKNFINSFFINRFGTKPLFINQNMNLPFKISYLKGLGSDRICNAAAALEYYGRKNILVIDFGTATTYTVIEKNILTGGLISPGIETSLISLRARTSLPEVKLNFPKKIINNNTQDNIKAGILFQSLFTAEHIITKLKKKHKDLFTIATGGFAKMISGHTRLIDETDSDLVLKGINKIISR